MSMRATHTHARTMMPLRCSWNLPFVTIYNLYNNNASHKNKLYRSNIQNIQHHNFCVCVITSKARGGRQNLHTTLYT